MDSPAERACPRCAAPADAPQRWCLECGAELPQRRRAGLRSAVGLATALAVLVGAASAGGYTLLRKDTPPRITTVAQQPSGTAGTPSGTLPPAATQEPPSTPAIPPSTFNGATPGVTVPSPASATAPSPTSAPLQTTKRPQSGSHEKKAAKHRKDQTQPGSQGGTTTPTPPKLVTTNVALGAAAVAYAPYTTSDVDLGDPSRVNDGSLSTAWKTPTYPNAGAPPQVGVYIDLGDPQKVQQLVLRTPTPGMSFEVYGATSGPPASITDPAWIHLATRRSVDRRTAIHLPAKAVQYVLVWVTGLPGGADHAAISELALLGRQPA